MPSDLLSNIKDLLSGELSLCKALRTMISRELEIIVLERDMDRLLDVQEQKEEIISQLRLMADSWRDTLSSCGITDTNIDGMGARVMELFPDDEDIPSLLGEIKDISDSILKAEDEAKTELEKYAADLRSQLTSKAHGRKAAASYAKMGRTVF